MRNTDNILLEHLYLTKVVDSDYVPFDHSVYLHESVDYEGYPAWWLSPGSRLIDAKDKGHAETARTLILPSVLKPGETIPKDDAELYDLMFAKGYVRVMKNTAMNSIHFDHDPVRTIQSSNGFRQQVKFLKDMAIDKGNKLFDDTMNRPISLD